MCYITFKLYTFYLITLNLYSIKRTSSSVICNCFSDVTNNFKKKFKKYFSYIVLYVGKTNVRVCVLYTITYVSIISSELTLNYMGILRPLDEIMVVYDSTCI